MENKNNQLIKLDLIKILDVIHVSENLKKELRHSFASNGRPESVAEHSWRVVIMAVFLRSHLPDSLNWENLLEMLVVHDLAEAITGDSPIFAQDKNSKQLAEQRAIAEIREMLPEETGTRIALLWEEFEAGLTPESKLAHALDKLEAQIQHNEADLATWLEWEKHRIFGGLDLVSSCNPTINSLKEIIVDEAKDKLRAAGENLDALESGSASLS